MAEEYFDAEIYTLTDEEGNECRFEEIASYEDEETKTVYHAMLPLDDEGNEDGEEYVILKTEKDEDGEDILVTIEDDEEFDRIADIFEDGFAEIDYDFDGADEN